MTVFGWDCSDYDTARGRIDPVAAKADGISFLTHKATELSANSRIRHKNYGDVLTRSRDAGIEFLGAYVVPRSSATIQAQVDYFLAYVDEATPWWRTFPGWFFQVDTEKWGYDNVSPSIGAAMCTEIKNRTGKVVAHYAPKWAYGNTVPGDDPLWASNYGTNPAIRYQLAYPGDASTRWASYSGRVPTFLQFGSQTIIGGHNTCDANAFRGTIDEFRTFISNGIPSNQGVTIMFCKLGDKNSDVVRALQSTLKGVFGADLGSSGIDGNYGDKTKAALKSALGPIYNGDGSNYNWLEYSLLQIQVVLKVSIVAPAPPVSDEHIRELADEQIKGTKLVPPVV